jgi:alkylation response protein AidB-like acyl-CoA dehydrogenase
MSEAESRATVEASREQWKSPSFLKELFLGNLRLDLVEPFPEPTRETEGFGKFYADMKHFLTTEVNSAEIDQTGEYPPEVLEKLRKLGAFGMKIPKEYGGLGFTQAEYDTVMKLLGNYDGNLTALLSAHQSIGAPQPLKMFGRPDQKKKYLPRLAKGAISAFALTEPNVGSDPSKMESTVTRDENGDYILNGEKLWCTNGTLAEIIVVMARHADDPKKLSAFILEMNTPGITITHRCRFMGLRALSNAAITFKDVKIPNENLIGPEGAGLKIAFVTLNTGRLALPAGAVGCVKKCLSIVRYWAKERQQWGCEIGKHEANAQKISDMAATLFAMEAVADLGSRLADRSGYDIRLEAAAAKEFNTVCAWKIIDDTMQIRGGRGYENESSLIARGEVGLPVERMMRDFRINLIFEGSSEIMHLFMAREAVDKHFGMAKPFVDKTRKYTWQEKRKAGLEIFSFYSTWIPRLFFNPSSFGRFGKLAKHMNFVERACRRLARNTFYGMLVYGPKLEKKQAFLFRLMDIGMDLYAMSAAILRADQHEESATELADNFCRMAERRIKQKFHDLWRNDDSLKYEASRRVLDGEYTWLEQ